jgi:hypothetical protein
MSDKWPSVHENLTLDNHLVWRFQQLDNDRFLKLWITWLGHAPSQADIPMSCIPALACFDLEYWITMALEIEGGVKSNETEIVQKYMQNVREAIVEDILKANDRMRRDVSWSLDSIHEWSVRTLCGCPHSDFGRQKYTRKCQTEGILPYRQDVTMDGEFSKFLILNTLTFDGPRLAAIFSDALFEIRL